MAVVQRTNSTSIQYAREETPGELPIAPEWKGLQPNEIPNFGRTITTKGRDPINKLRQMEKGSIVDMDSGYNSTMDFTIELVKDFVDIFCFANFSAVPSFVPTDVGANTYVVTGGGLSVVDQNLVFARGFSDTENNGLKVVNGTPTATVITVSETLEPEVSVTDTVELDVCGYQGALDDIEIDVNGDIFTNGGIDFTTLNLTVGQGIQIGDNSSPPSVYSFDTVANSGLARIISITSTVIELDKRQQAFSIDAGTGKTIRLFFGPFVKNVATDDVDWLEQSLQFEIAYEDFVTPEYEYSIGNYPNTFVLTTNLNDLAMLEMDFVGLDTGDPTTTRATDADAGLLPIKVDSINTTSDFARLRLQNEAEDDLLTYVKGLVFTIDNGISPEKVLNQLPAAYMNYSNFNISVDLTVLFTDTSIITALNQNVTVGVDFCLQSDDGAVYFDVPSMVLGGGTKNFPINESVNISLTGQAFKDDDFDSSIGVTYFPYFP